MLDYAYSFTLIIQIKSFTVEYPKIIKKKDVLKDRTGREKSQDFSRRGRRGSEWKGDK